jgi:hypothetical protein
MGTGNRPKTVFPLQKNRVNDGELFMARQAESGANHPTETNPFTETEVVSPGRAAFPPQRAEVDMEKIVEQVSRLIFRRLAVERERRGGGRWP